MASTVNSKNLPALARYFETLNNKGIATSCPEYDECFKEWQERGETNDFVIRCLIEHEVNTALLMNYIASLNNHWQIEHCEDNSVQLFRHTHDYNGEACMDIIRVAHAAAEGYVVLSLSPQYPAGNEAVIQLPAKHLFEWFKQAHYALRSIDTTDGN